MERVLEQSGGPAVEWVAVYPEADALQPVDTLSGQRAHLWALVLESRSVPCRAERWGMGWQLLVPAEQVATARNELHLFEEENRNWPPLPPPVRRVAENTLATLSVLILLATFHNLTQLDIPFAGHDRLDWTELGMANAARILDGQWWRTITALTLHANGLHLLSNLAFGGILVVCLCRELGSGLAWSLLLGSGALGNLANALLHPPTHSSVGASTAVFGAVGILCSLSVVVYRHGLSRRWPLPFGAALALLALMGTEGKQTDLGAHLFGFLFGIGLGLAAGYWVERHGRPGWKLNLLLACAAAGAVLWAWWEALSSVS